MLALIKMNIYEDFEILGCNFWMLGETRYNGYLKLKSMRGD